MKRDLTESHGRRLFNWINTHEGGAGDAGTIVDAWLETWSPGIYRFAHSLCKDAHLAEDLTQETMLRAWRHRNQLRDPAKARVWLYRIATNLWKDHLRRGKSVIAKAEPLLRELIDNGNRSTLEGQEEVELALCAMRSLPDRQREVLHLHACECMSLEDIADVLGITKESAKASLSLARKKMRAQLGCILPGPMKTNGARDE